MGLSVQKKSRCGNALEAVIGIHRQNAWLEPAKKPIKQVRLLRLL
jgi:hypothetical protein